MGQEIDTDIFSPEDFERFAEALRSETDLLGECFRERAFSDKDFTAGFELEAWLTDREAMPSPLNGPFLDTLQNSLVVPELSQFNVEINGSPTTLKGRAFSRLADELEFTWARCRECAQDLGAHILMIGILPTVVPEALNLQNMSSLARYAALNAQLLSLRHGVPFELRIDGHEKFRRTHPDVMLEAAATSFQIHLQVRQDNAARLFNASLVAAAPMVAVSANSPYLFGHDLWDESRIPLFEQAVAVGSADYQRVSFGSGWCRESLFELFEENRDHYPILMPSPQRGGRISFAHLRFHNGTIWRWNRPLVGFDHDGRPHLRIEHRVVPAGPTVVDAIANSALYYGLVAALGERSVPIEQELDFEAARNNFYEAARTGLDARLVWPGAGGRVEARTLLAEHILPLAHEGLSLVGIPADEAEHFLGIIEGRLRHDMTGARWQRRWVERHGRDMAGLTLAYMERQATGVPVHRWTV